MRSGALPEADTADCIHRRPHPAEVGPLQEIGTLANVSAITGT
jgi:hypothetical protein